MKKILCLVGIILLAASFAFAAECGENPSEDCDISTTTVVNISNSPYTLNDTAGDGAIRINASNLILDFNWSILEGNGTTGSIGVLIGASLNNVTIQNSNISNYTYNVRVDSTIQPNFASVAQGVRNLTYTFDSTNRVFTLDCQGTGNVGLDQLAYVGGSLGYYTIYHDGTYVGKSNSDTYTISSCSQWIFAKSDKVRDSLTTQESALFFIMIFLVVFGALYALIQNPGMGFVMVFLGAALAVYILRGLL